MRAFSLVVESGGCSLAAVGGRLTAVTSVVAEHGLGAAPGLCCPADVRSS